ncbi:MAG: TetR/AcrR family transcriptional regulator [Deltaproteobacteria bacterium]|nr:TetR/AcrR family transcriptional regulator [Deltaproteobacteria bacterium]
MTPKIIDKEIKKMEISSAAIKIFINKGISNTSISEIAREAGIGKGTVYEYFSSKDELAIFAASSWINLLEQTSYDSVNKSDTPDKQLKDLFKHTTSNFIKHPEIISFFIELIGYLQKNMHQNKHLQLIKRIGAPVRKHIVDILQYGIDKKFFREEIAKDLEKTAINLVAFVDGLGLQYVSDPQFFNLDIQINCFLDYFLNSIRK